MESVAAADFLPMTVAAAPAKQPLVVSIHDVAPSTRKIVAKMISELAQKGVRVCSLLVVPDYHHTGHFAQDRQFVSWLRELEAAGNEIVIHGYFHERPTRPNESVSEKFITGFYTRGEGEFYDLEYNEAFRRIIKARDEFRAAGFTPRGFIAPAWLLNSEGERAARDADLEYTTRLTTVRDLRSAQTFPTRSLVYSVQTHWRRVTSRAWNRTLMELMKNNPLLRLGLHPPDRLYPRVWRQIIDLVDRMQSVRTPTTYRDWIAEQRQKSLTTQ